jgi:hypothetical protein
VIGGAVYLMLVGSSPWESERSSATRREESQPSPAIFFVIPPLMNILPTSWNNAISQYLPE